MIISQFVHVKYELMTREDAEIVKDSLTNIEIKMLRAIQK